MLFHFLSSLFLYCFLTDSQFSKIHFLDVCRDTMFDKARFTAFNIHIQVVTYSSLLTISLHVQVQLLSLIISKETQISQWIQRRLDDTQHCRCIYAVKAMFCYNFCIYWTNFSVLFLIRQACIINTAESSWGLAPVVTKIPLRNLLKIPVCSHWETGITWDQLLPIQRSSPINISWWFVRL